MRAIKKALLALTVVAGAVGFIASGPISAKAQGLSIDAPGIHVGVRERHHDRYYRRYHRGYGAYAADPGHPTAIITTTATPGAAGRISQFRTGCASRTLAVEPKSKSK